jgi:hypothetical protein
MDDWFKEGFGTQRTQDFLMNWVFLSQPRLSKGVSRTAVNSRDCLLQSIYVSLYFVMLFLLANQLKKLLQYNAQS